MTGDVVIHVGYGKTATTWLQEKVFSTLDPEMYLGKRAAHFPDWLLRLNYLDEFAFAATCPDLRNEIHAAIRDRQRVIISSEAFTNFSVIYQQIERIRYVFAEARIIIVLRNPIDWLISNYRYCVEYEYFHLPLESYLDFAVNRTPFALEKRPPFYIPDFYYSEVVERYRLVFGGDRVCVLRYEDFVADPGSFGIALSRFLGITLVDFERKAQERLLQSKDGATVERIRSENMARHVLEAGFNADGVSAAAAGTGLISEATEKRLWVQLAPYCAPFYPEFESEPSSFPSKNNVFAEIR